uniref:Nuclear Hormone Receptor family n=1 Tax=Strongyloides venezuelensis TaxID=75913 RepID=A0A0K0FCF0_STRVS
MLNDNMEKNYCLVCNIETKSIHNSVNSCRACSAFFRRGIIIHKHFRCRRGTNNCVMKPGDKLFCKYCRFEKCKVVGMVLRKGNIDFSNSSPIHSNINDELQTKDDGTLLSLSPSIVPLLNCDIKVEDNRIFFDMKGIKNNINKIFLKAIPSLDNYNSYTTCLQRVIKGLEILFTNLSYDNPEDCIFIKEIAVRRFINKWQNFITFSPNFLMVLEEFASLSLKDKWIIFRNFWRFGDIITTLIYKVKIENPTNEALLVCDYKHIIKMKNVEFLDPDMDNRRSKEAFYLMKPTLMLFHEFLYLPMKQNNYDNVEVAYMITQIMFDKLILNETSKECQKVGGEIQKVINNEIHNYYIYNKKLENYAYRITEMTKLLSMIREYINRQKEINLISKIMNLIDISFMNNL